MKLCSCNFAPFGQYVRRFDVIWCCVNPTFDLPTKIFSRLSYLNYVTYYRAALPDVGLIDGIGPP